jgi:hypothetical protein
MAPSEDVTLNRADRTVLAVLRQKHLSPLILRSRASGVSKDEADIRASWFETAHSRLLTMRFTV